MKLIKQFSVSLLAFAAASAFAAATPTSQTFTPTSAIINFDTNFLTANNISVAALGSGSVDVAAGFAKLPIGSLTITSSPGSLIETTAAGAGIALTANGFTVNATNFIFDNTNDTLYADLSALGGFINKPRVGLLTAGSVLGDFGGLSLDAVTTSSSARTLNMLASNFSLGADVVSMLGANAAAFSFVTSSIKDVRVGTVQVTPTIPEPSTYALMGLGLVGMGMVMRRRQQQA